MALQAARTLAVLICKHEYDARYQTLDDKLYIAQRYFPLITLVSTIYFFLLKGDFLLSHVVLLSKMTILSLSLILLRESMLDHWL